MNQTEQLRLENTMLEFALMAFAAHEPLRNALIFKGARILNLRLGDTAARESFDLDSNLDIHCANIFPCKEQQRDFLKREIEIAIKRYIAQQNPARFRFKSVKTELSPPQDNHPFDWTGFSVKIRLLDNKISWPNQPAVEIDIAAPETFGADVVTRLEFHGLYVNAYTLERIAGEKMRAFLSSLSSYQSKIGRRSDKMRVKDLYDIARICRRYEINDTPFWRTAGREFKLACESRFVDCNGVQSFAEDLDTIQSLFSSAPTLPKDIPFDEAWSSIQKIVALFENFRIIPFRFLIPNTHISFRDH